MNTSKLSLSTTLVITLLVGLTISNAALAHRYYGRSGGWSRGAYLGVPIGIGIGLGLGYGYYSPYYGSPYYGAPYYGMPYYPPAPVYYSPPVQIAPVTYSEQGSAPQANPQQNTPQNTHQGSPQSAQGAWWYYCVDAKGYYPYVNQCPGGWLRVSPQPAAGPDAQPTSNNSTTP